MKEIYSYWACLILVILIIVIINAGIGFIIKKQFIDKDLRNALFTLIFSHIQLLIG
jgi:VIT1/CCC1 family predicted Fe2+/Mn2+ transporter